jgi:AraC family transcriptional regulator
MGNHAFLQAPGQAARLREVYPEMVNEGSFGISQGWDIAVFLWRARNGFDAYYPGNDHHTLSFILSGASIERLDGRFAGKKGYAELDSFMLYAGGGSRHYASRGHVFICHFYFRPTLVRDVAARERGISGDGVELRDDRIFAHDLELRRLADNYQSRAADTVFPPTQLEMDTYSLLIGLCLLRRHSNQCETTNVERGGLSGRRLAAVLEYIDAHFAETISLQDLAQIAGLSPRHLCCAFRRSVGMAPHRYLVERRLERAKLLLGGTGCLAQIALDCGFASQQHFTSAFRQALGTTPGVMRKSMRL